MKVSELIKIILIALILVSCTNKKSKKTVVDKPQENVVDESKKSYSNEEIAKYTISSIMNQPYEILEVKQLPGVGFHVYYIRHEDNKKFDYKIRISGNNVIWGNLDGRWRDTKFDEKVGYSVERGSIKIIQTFEDGSEIVKEFSKTD